MRYSLRHTPPPQTKPRPVWWRRLRCWATNHDFHDPGYSGTVTCPKCKETWP